MKWEGGRSSGNVEDRRGMGGGALAGGGIGVAVLGLIGYLVFGIDPRTTEQVANSLGAGGAQVEGQLGTPRDPEGRFVSTILANTTDVWKTQVQGYEEPKLVVYDQGTQTGCGFGQAAMGPFYCPNDRKVYIDLAFWRELETQFQAGGDFARAYVIAHEIGHHVQTYTGASDRAQQARGLGEREGNQASVALELQADCYAGVWAANASAASNGQVALEAGDLEEGITAASAVGDDTIQRRTRGEVVPDSFTHGSSVQRVQAFRIGYEGRRMEVCRTGI